MKNSPKNENEEYVLYIIKADKKLNKANITNADVREVSFFDEKEILFFPFSCFEIADCNKENNNNFNYYTINLVYLGKYKEKIKNKEKIPESKYVTDILNSVIIDKIELEKESEKFLFDFNKFLPPETKKGYIIATYKISNEDLNKNIQILNYNYNKKEIEDIVDIYIKDKKINFSFFYNFAFPGEYKFTIAFKKLLTDASKLFYNCKNLISIDLNNFKTNYIKNMDDMFNGCSSIENLDLLSFKTKQVTSMKKMFYNCKALKSVDLSSFNTINVKSMSNMFGNCTSLDVLNLSSFNTENVIDMNSMFLNCSSLFFINLSSFNTKKVANMADMFYNCSSLISLHISSFEIKKSTCIVNMFLKCKSLKDLYVSEYFLNKSINIYSMFKDKNNLPNITCPLNILNKFN